MEKSNSIKFYSEVKTMRMKVHPRNFTSEDVVINFDWFSKEKFQLIPGTVIEIFPIEEKKSKDRRNHLLLEVKSLSYDLQSKGGPISISQEVATAFSLVSGRESCIRRVDKELVALDLVEFRFKDQVLSRSDMWRFTNSLIGKGMYVSRKIEFAGLLLKVSDLWAQGDRVKSGVVVDSSRVVFRSASSQMFLFIQVSCEMWEFDPSGDMYIDKAVDGFLKDLFNQWKEKNCNHEVSLILFSRKYYRSLDLAESQATTMTDRRGNYYQDYYKVIFNKETRKDWMSAIIEVKQGLKQFQAVLKPGKNPHRLIYEGEDYEEGREGEWISSAPEGNILEAMNLAVNILENQYREVSFSTTGQQVVMVSPGVGVFEVDQQMNLMTRERIIDNGIGADLVCLNEQPLHSVPLFKFHQSDSSDGVDYHIPHWINYSYYNPPRSWNNKNLFKPRILISDHLINKHLKAKMAPRGSIKPVIKLPSILSSDPTDPLVKPSIDYDEYDAAIFTSSSHSNKKPFRIDNSPVRKIRSLTEDIGRGESPSTVGSRSPDVFDNDSPSLETRSIPNLHLDNSGRKRTVMVEGDGTSSSYKGTSSSYHMQPRARHYSDNFDSDPFIGTVYKSGSAENIRNQHKQQQLKKKRRTLINPFDPRKTHVEEVSSHNCRWIHTFPRDREGKPFQRHHKQQLGLKSVEEGKELSDFEGSSATPSVASTVTTAISSPLASLTGGVVNDSLVGVASQAPKHTLSALSLTSLQATSPNNKKKIVQNFSTVKREGMDWTSFVEPACLPLTTDYYPEDSTLQRDYTDYPTNLTVNAYGEPNESKVSLDWRSDHLNMSTIQSFNEMISQRLLQGFQLVFDKDHSLFTLHCDLQELKDYVSGKSKKKKEKEIVVKFSLGRVFQRIDLNNLDMLAHTFRSKHPLGVKPFNYRYQLVIGTEDTVSHQLTLTQVGMDGYNWNYLDQHVCGHQDFDIYQDSNKFWRCRYLLLPAAPPPYDSDGDTRQRWVNEMINEFIKLTEFINHIKRTPPGATGPGNKELNRLHSVPVSPFLHSRSPSPTPTPKHHSDESYRRMISHSPNAPLRAITEPYGVGGAHRNHRNTTSGMRKARSKEDLTRGGRESPHPLKTPQPFQSLQLRSKDEVLSDLKQLTFSPNPKTPPTSSAHGRQRGSHFPLASPLQQSFLDEEGREEDSHAHINLIPPSLSSGYSSKTGFESSLDYPSLEVSESFDGTLSIDSPSDMIVAQLFDKQCGVDMFNIDKQSSVECCFGLEAVNWITDNINTVSRSEAVKLLERLFDEKFIAHVSGNRKIQFVDGCYMYCKTQDTLSEDWDLFKKKWFEVSVVYLDDILKPYHVGGGSNLSSYASSYISSVANSPYYNYREKSGSTMTDTFNRYLEVNPDTRKKSDRPEWCYVQYSNSYHPLHAYEVEFQWMVATSSLLNEMIQGLTHKASMCGFSLVPVLPFSSLKPRPSDTAFYQVNPFYHPISIPLDVPTQLLKERQLDVMNFVMLRFQLILKKFGFLLDPSSRSNDVDIPEVSWGGGHRITTPTKGVYIHYSGSALLEPWVELSDNTCGFYWYKNSYYLSQKTTQSSALGKYNDLFQEFCTYCVSQKANELIINDDTSEQYYNSTVY